MWIAQTVPTRWKMLPRTLRVKDAVVNFMALKMKVEFEEGADPASVMDQVRNNCKKVEPDCEVFL